MKFGDDDDDDNDGDDGDVDVFPYELSLSGFNFWWKLWAIDNEQTSQIQQITMII